jgi:iron-sulfur cluster assembly protein
MTTITSQSGITLTTPAITKAKELLKKEGHNGAGLRVGVSKGGCAGMSYALTFDEEKSGDKVFDHEGLKVFVQEAVLPLFDGITIDYVDGLDGAGFRFSNPQATGGCGCGKSFSA